MSVGGQANVKPVRLELHSVHLADGWVVFNDSDFYHALSISHKLCYNFWHGKFRGEQYITETGDFLNGIDHEANEKLNREIADLRSEECRVKVGEKTDTAYNNPDNIKNTYDYLERGDAKLKEVRKHFIHKNLATAAIANVLDKTPFMKTGKWGEKIDSHLEVFRDKLLYGKDQTDSQPWHNQRGSALTFLTISEAEDLSVLIKMAKYCQKINIRL